MLVYRLYKSAYINDPLSAEGARRAGGRWNPKGVPILYTSATPELALLEIIAHLNPAFVPAFQLLVLEIPDGHRAVSITDLPVDWQAETEVESVQAYLADWLSTPNELTVSVPSAIVSRSRNYLIHILHPDFRTAVRIIENIPFAIDTRLLS
ncbi:RES family NAD+ phosphorylase [Spirosoma rhododendri]|uniref:RES family NAD+ phosphorylase n=1 Tax=Spirosoma rhododendri TaxID=2728024 RepID=A0A7L5DZ33_9BACT|nr:RES family NAD+ phosphorylase [Spirosoma rhododendri]QJD80760.1 RES family NAD+ phosphorylase [Spirosoma rhododendri]